MIAMLITLSLMTIVFTLMRQNQVIFATETGVTSTSSVGQFVEVQRDVSHADFLAYGRDDDNIR